MKINGNDYVVAVDVQDATTAEVVVNGVKYSVESSNPATAKSTMAKPQVAAVPASHPVTNLASPAQKPKAQSAVSAGESAVLSPLPGVVLDIKVAVGDTVAVGDRLLVLEAMKMENNVDSSVAGVVKSVKAKQGDSVMEGDVLITIG